MKGVKAGHVAGPFDAIPFNNFIQSPVGLVPKAGNKTRLIFHLSYDFNKAGDSVNGCTPKDRCSVRYNNLDTAIKHCLLLSERAEIINGHKIIFLGKTDLSNAFRVLCLNRKSFKWLVFKAEKTLVMENSSFLWINAFHLVRVSAVCTTSGSRML